MEKINSDPNIFPEIEIVPSPLRIARDCLRFVGARLYLCDDEAPQRGASEMLDRALEE